MARAVRFKRTLRESASGETGMPLAPSGTAWDADEARKAVAKLSSSDGSGAKDKISWPKYRKAFLWCDTSDEDNFGGYKLPFADVFDGTLKAVWNGVVAAAAALGGAHGKKLGVPDGDVAGIKGKLRTLYKRFGKGKPPFDRVEESVKPQILLRLPGCRPVILVEKTNPSQIALRFVGQHGLKPKTPIS